MTDSEVVGNTAEPFPYVDVDDQGTNFVNGAYKPLPGTAGFQLTSAAIVQFTDVVFDSNIATSNGQSGGLSAFNGSLTNVVFAGNRSGSRGQDHIADVGSAITRTNVTFQSQSLEVPRITLNASRTSCTAPCAIYFDTEGTVSGSVDARAKPLYTWDFDDPTAPDWAALNASTRLFTDTGESSNTALDHATAHLFETPGTFDVTVNMVDPDGSTASASVTINVADPDTVFSGNDTTCISTSGNFSGCPAGADTETASAISRIAANDGTGKRVLMRRGETFTGTNYALNIGGNSPDLDKRG